MPDANFLRMQGIYGSPDFAGGDATDSPVYSGFMSSVLPMMERLRQEANSPQRFDEQLNRQIRTKQALDMIGRQAGAQAQTAPQNVVMAPSISSQAQEMGAAKDIWGEDVLDPTSGFKQAQMALKGAQLEQKTQADIGKQKIAESRAGIAAGQLDLNKFKVTHPNMQLVKSNDGRAHAIDPITHQMMDLGDTGMSAEEIATLNEKNAEQLEGIRQTGRMELQKEKGAEAVTTKETPSGTPFQPSQQHQELYNKAEQLFNTHPEYQSMIKLDPTTKSFVISPPATSGIFGIGASAEKDKASQDMYHAINDAIYNPSAQMVKPTEKKPTTLKSDNPLGLNLPGLGGAKK